MAQEPPELGQQLSFEGGEVTGKKSKPKIQSAVSMNGTSINAALVATGTLKYDEVGNSDGEKLDIFPAFMVSFCIAFGAGIALVGWYPKLTGFLGYTICIVIVSVVGAVAENALHVTAIKTKASSFAELTADLPGFMSVLTSCSMVLWGFTLAGLYVQFIYTFINGQILGTALPKDGQGNSWQLYFPIGFFVFGICLPPKFGGGVVKVLTNFNLSITWVVIIFAIVKGFTMLGHEDRPQNYTIVEPGGFLQVIVLLAGAMFQCTAVPQLQHEIKPESKEKAAWVIPLLLGSVQGVVFLIVGFMGYWALGNCISDSGDIFSSYAEVANDWMVAVLQGGIACLMYLSLPLLSVPPKNELWNTVAKYSSARDENGDPVDLASAPMAAQLCLTGVLTVYAIFLPMIVGRARVTQFVTILGGTAANWMNLFLPCAVIVTSNIIPARKAGEPFTREAVKVAVIFILASCCLGNSIAEIIGMFGAAGAPTADIDTETCWN